MVVVVLAFDVDGTLACGNPRGPLNPEILLRLKEKGFIVGVVGAYEKVPVKIREKLDFVYGGHPFKPQHLAEVKSKFKPDLTLYIADEQADKEACLKTGVTYVHPENFKV